MEVIQIEGTPTNSVSIAFKVGEDVSVALYDAVSGHIRVLHALTFVEVLREFYVGADGELHPSLRNPNAVMVEYIRRANEGIPGNPGDLYLGQDGRSSANHGAGHWVIDVVGDLNAQFRAVAKSMGGADGLLFELYWLLRDTGQGP